MAKLTNTEAIELVTDFILQSPPGEVKEVVRDVVTLMSDTNLLDRTIVETMREYNTVRMIQCRPEYNDEPPSEYNPYTLLITKNNEVGTGEYLDSKHEEIVKFDHLRQKIVETRSVSILDYIDAKIEHYRKAVEVQIDAYVCNHFLYGTASVFAKEEDDFVHIVVCISSTKVSPQNFWGGSWRSTWHCRFSDNQNPVRINIKGKIETDVHYYESGNVQMKGVCEKSRDITTTPDEVPTACAKVIKDFEAEYVKGIDDHFHNLDNSTVKAIKRFLPVTRTKIDWSKIVNCKYGMGYGDVMKND
eukprot:CAMPEP_0174253050 /NCGR_PEP_ID=MMETSP0439-20130205/2444_1 /TAXON_ID=0 /ORGANISM="Stereomyxa ramosa, Strain Chinc5" /LENGTH=301 /DNA_ID=CAMNT_0015333857 /DNA_START=30 /DNA_END=935 /DNA_ORIENTATION=-